MDFSMITISDILILISLFVLSFYSLSRFIHFHVGKCLRDTESGIQDWSLFSIFAMSCLATQIAIVKFYKTLLYK